MKVVVVAFKVSEEDAVYYRKREILMDEGKVARGAGVDEALGAMLVNAFEKGADFVSVRFVRTEPGRVILENLWPKSSDYDDLLKDPRTIDYTKAGGVFGKKELDEAKKQVEHEDAPSAQFEEPCVCPSKHDRCEAWSVKMNSKHRDLIIGHCSGCELRTTGFATEKPIQSARLITDPWAHEDVSA